jgi:rhodanese-related sulfurtransferase
LGITSLASTALPTYTLVSKPLLELSSRGYKKDGKGKKGGKKDDSTPKAPKAARTPPRVRRFELRQAARKAEREAIGRPVTEADPLPAEDIYTMLSRAHNTPQFGDYENSISTKELKDLLDADKQQFVIVDLRTSEEINLLKDHPIRNSISVPINPIPSAITVDVESGEDPNDFFRLLHELPMHKWADTYKVPKLKQDDKIVFYSCSQNRSRLAVKSAQKLGYKDAKFLLGGARTWNKYYNPLGV